MGKDEKVRGQVGCGGGVLRELIGKGVISGSGGKLMQRKLPGTVRMTPAKTLMQRGYVA